MSSQSLSHVQKSFLKYQHTFVLIAPLLFLASVFAMVPTPSGVDMEYWLQYWWLFLVFLIGTTIVNTVGISGPALFVPFLTFIFPIFTHPLDLSTLVKVGPISEALGFSSSAAAFIQYGLVDRRLALTPVGGSIPFVIGGVLLSFVIPDVVLHALLGIALLAASYLLFNADLGHDEPGSLDTDHTAATDGGTVSASPPNDPGKLGPAGVNTADDGTVTRVDRDGDDYTYTRGGYPRRFANYSVGGMFQGLAGLGTGELGIISMLGMKVSVRVAIGMNHIVVALTAILVSLVHVFGGGLVGGHSLSLTTTPWNMIVFTVLAAVLGGQITPYVSNALETSVIKNFVGVLFTVISLASFLTALGI